MHLKDLKNKKPAELVSMAEELEIEGASTLRKQDLMFAILKEMAEDGEQIIGEGTIEVLPDSFGFKIKRDCQCFEKQQSFVYEKGLLSFLLSN